MIPGSISGPSPRSELPVSSLIAVKTKIATGAEVPVAGGDEIRLDESTHSYRATACVSRIVAEESKTFKRFFV